jgi:hypothetical protein
MAKYLISFPSAAILSVVLASCNGPIQLVRASGGAIVFPEQALREIAVSTPGTDFQELAFVITDAAPTGNGTAIVASGLYRARPVSFRAVIDRHAGQYADSAVRLESLGTTSDSFVSSLADVYGAGAPRRMKAFAIFDAIPLEGDPANLGAGELQLKLFCRARTENQYCELYLNTNLRTGIVEIVEKDPEYRRALLAWLGRS